MGNFSNRHQKKFWFPQYQFSSIIFRNGKTYLSKNNNPMVLKQTNLFWDFSKIKYSNVYKIYFLVLTLHKYLNWMWFIKGIRKTKSTRCYSTHFKAQKNIEIFLYFTFYILLEVMEKWKLSWEYKFC